MESIEFKINLWALFFCLSFSLVLVVFYLIRRKDKTSQTLFYSDLKPLKHFQQKGRVKFIHLPTTLKIMALIFFIAALTDPYLLIERKHPKEDSTSKNNTVLSKETEKPKEEEITLPSEGIAIYFVLDQSGSMSEEMHVAAKRKSQKRLSRLDTLKQVTNQFIKGNDKLGLKGRHNDLIGLVSFARVAKILSPLTLDHNNITNELSKLSVVNHRNEDGTAIGYAIYKTVNTIAATKYFAEQLVGNDRPSYSIQKTAIILVTDGLQNPHPLDKHHPLRNISIRGAANQAKEQGIRLYIINVVPFLAHPQFQEQQNEFEQAALMTGGKFFVVGNKNSLPDIYQEIDTIEKTELSDQRKLKVLVTEKINHKESDSSFDRFLFFPYLIFLGLGCLLLAVILQTTILRRIP